VLGDVGLTVLLFTLVRRATRDLRAARWAVLAYWLNPAVLLNGAVLGYWDPLLALLAIGALAAAERRPALSGALFAAAALLKPQAVFVGPGLPLGWLRHAEAGLPLRGALRAAVAALLVAALIVAPVVAAGGGGPMLDALASLGSHDMLSGDAANLWWLVTWLKRAAFPEAGPDSPVTFTTPVRILRVSTLTAQGYPNPRPWATAALLVVCTWAIWRGRRARALTTLAALSAFVVHAYFALAVGVHENHLFLAVPLLTLVAADLGRYRGLLAAVSAIAALNLYLFYGLGLGVGYALPRTLTGVDATVWLAAGTLLTFVWHARLFAAAAAGWRTPEVRTPEARPWGPRARP
jgi:Gpi18-like mannosyltransferase